MSKKLIEQTYALNTAFKANYYDSTSSFTYVFPERLTNVVDIRVSSIEIPVDVYFTISSYIGNNSFTIIISDATGNSFEKEILLPDGNYPGAEQLAFAVQQSINETFYMDYTDADGTFTTISGEDLFDVSHNGYLIKFDFTYNNNLENYFEEKYTGSDTSEINVTIRFSNLEYNPTSIRTLGYILGFRESDYTLNTATDGATAEPTTVAESETACNIAPTKSFYIALEDYKTNYRENIKVGFFNHYLRKNIIARVPFTKTSDRHGSFILNKFTDTPMNVRRYDGPTDIQKIKLEILDDFGDVVNFLGTDFGFLITTTVEVGNETEK
tara:strand:+ start:7690 stop:8667 length:978 start_codon:yes stop_codon:yes gene_type:complete